MINAILEQGSGPTVKIGPFVDSLDGDTDETSLTIAQADVRLSKNGGNMAQKSEASSCTHDELGMYNCVLNSTDTNTAGILTLTVHEAGALHVVHRYLVVPSNVYNSLVGGTDNLQVDAVQISGDTTAANNLETACDNYSATRGLAGTALPAAAADAAGGLPISDAGGLDMDAILADTNELQGDDVPGLIAALNDVSAADVNAQCDLAISDAEPISANVTQISGSTTAADNLEETMETVKLGAINDTTATTTVLPTDLILTNDDEIIGKILSFRSGSSMGVEATAITDYDQGTGQITVDALSKAPANTDQFAVI